MSMKLYVGNLSYETTGEQLKELFSQFGTVESANVIIEKHTGRSKGFGFVEFGNEEEAKKAIEGLNEKEFMGRNLSVAQAKPPSEHGSGGGGRRFGGGGGGGRRFGGGGGGGRGGFGGGGRGGGGGRY